MSERWLPIPGWEGLYEASSSGRVRSLARLVEYRGSARSGPFERVQPGRLIVPAVSVDGYGFVTLARDGSKVRRSVHRLVAAAFHGPSDGRLVRHIDGNPGNNAASNLAWGTCSDNEADKARHGRTVCGERNKKSKLTEKDVPAIFKMAGEGRRQRDIAKRFGVCQQVIWSVLNRRTWRHVPVDALALAAVWREVSRVG